jgi:ketosteroid isomerase-like protein
VRPKGTSRSILFLSALAWACVVLAQGRNLELTAELEAMAETERAFSRTAGEKGWQHAFYDFFAEEGVGFQPAPVKYRENYRKNPPPPDPLTSVLEWEPLYGDISESADLGWLTGPYRVTDKREQKPTFWGFYSSVWKKQPDGTWRVLADMGIAIPPQQGSLPRNQFTAAPADKSKAGNQRGPVSLRRAEQHLARDAARNPDSGFRKWLSNTARVHRNGMMPLVTSADIAGYLSEHPRTGSWETLHAEVSQADDLGHTYGRYELKNADGTVEKGHYMRVWKRNVDGDWRVVLDVNNPLPPEKK